MVGFGWSMQRMREAIMLVFVAIWSSSKAASTWWRSDTDEAWDNCLSWRLGVEANNIRAWRTVPPECSTHVEVYMVRGQYQRDVNLIVDTICAYIDTIDLSSDGLDAWILDVDDTCISNLFYYSGKRYGCEPFDPVGFKAWALSARLFVKLIAKGFKVFLVTGRDEDTLGQATIRNLHAQGFFAYHHDDDDVDDNDLCRSGAYKGQSAIAYKSTVRKQLAEEGFRIWGNVGDQWSDLQGEYTGNRTFKLPNPMYYIP
ncbi:hypothetical protein SASPL_108838 [Salvia splendens]|uniref:Acid phosphatase 1 n=1 Tax=Salvia splendens TaxID=180675 RepID=A0A8X8YF70_SALSN|nr:hypothetical protein SASPL_108838 [Salvia splendens]